MRVLSEDRFGCRLEWFLMINFGEYSPVVVDIHLLLLLPDPVRPYFSRR
jgi:hypothetical protein